MVKEIKQKQRGTASQEVLQEEMGHSPTWHPGAIDHLGPLLLVGGDFDVVTVGALVAVPQQQPERGQQAVKATVENIYLLSEKTNQTLTQERTVS